MTTKENMDKLHAQAITQTRIARIYLCRSSSAAAVELSKAIELWRTYSHLKNLIKNGGKDETTSRSNTSKTPMPQTSRCSECITTEPDWTRKQQCLYCGCEIEPQLETPAVDGSYSPTIGDLVAVAAMR